MTDSDTTDGDSTDSQPDRSELETARAIVDEAIGRGISRRALMLAAAAGVSGAALGTLGGRASAASPSDASGTVYFDQIGDQNNPVSEFYVSNQYNVSSQGQTINVDQIDDDGSGDVEFLSPVSAGQLLSPIRTKKVTIPDDSVVTVGRNKASIVVISSETGFFGSGMFIYRSNDITTIETDKMSNEGNTTLSGTTGPDGTLNIAVDVGPGLQFENRTGGKHNYKVTQFPE